MLEQMCWLFKEPCDAFCITTNGFIKKNGRGVMGSGCAAQANKRIDNLDLRLGTVIEQKGNVVNKLTKYDSRVVIMFPVKPESTIATKDNIVSYYVGKVMPGQKAPGFLVKATTDIILESIKQLVALTDECGWKKVLLPRPGCGSGELDWDEVKPIIEPLLDDRFVVVHWEFNKPKKDSGD